ncbi:MAG: ATP-binding protein [Planctomycetota bacterium]
MDESNWNWELNETIPSSKEIGHRLIEKLLAALTEVGWDGSEFFHVQMAAEEAMINAVTHGNKEDEKKTIEIEFKVSADSAFLRFKDQGEGFSPEALPDPTDEDHLEVVHGRGVFLIRNMMSEVSYNESGNEVTMLKHRKPEAA